MSRTLQGPDRRTVAATLIRGFKATAQRGCAEHIPAFEQFPHPLQHGPPRRTVAPFDLATVLGNWGPCPGCPADLDGNGQVGPFDLALLLGDWGPCE